MGCQCSKQEDKDVGDLDVDYDYNENVDEYKISQARNKPENLDKRKNSYPNNQSIQDNNLHNNINIGVESRMNEDTEGNYEDFSKSNKKLSQSQNITSKEIAENKAIKEEQEYIFSQSQNKNKNNNNNNNNTINESLNQSQVPSMMNYDQSFAKKNNKHIKPYGYSLKYNTEILKLFNIARNKPLSFCKHIDYCIGLITTNAEGQLVLGTEKTNKIGLKDGISKFNESKRFLLHIDSCEELKYDSELEIEISENSDLWLNNEYIKNKIIDKQSELLNFSSTMGSEITSKSKDKKSEYSIFGFHFDFGMSDPAISSVLQVVDDNNCENRRRYNIMNSEYKAVGITNKIIGNKFVSYFFFAG
jgi:hypothetical protein